MATKNTKIAKIHRGFGHEEHEDREDHRGLATKNTKIAKIHRRLATKNTTIALSSCPGCGALFPPYDGPTHRYLGASASCWAVFNGLAIGQEPDGPELVSGSRIPDVVAPIPASGDISGLDALFGDAYGVQHHGQDSSQAIQSVACHLLNLHGIISGHTTRHGWALARALRIRGVFHKLEPPALGSALTIRHLFPGGGVLHPVTRSQYVLSVYTVWMSRHRSTVEQWYERYVVPDRLATKITQP